MQYLVTTNVALIPATPIAMVDGTTPGWVAKEGDLHYDHHRVGGAEIQIDEIVQVNPISQDYTIVTTQVDADACVAAAYLQLYPRISLNDQRKLRAIAFDCDHLAVPDDLADLADFAAQAVAAMKAEGFKVAQELGLPEDRKQWTEDQKVAYASEGFRQGAEWLIAAIKGDRTWPGELGEAAQYWEQVQKDEQQLIDEGRITKCRDALIFDMMGWQGRYVDPRASLRAAKRLNMDATITLTQRETKDGGWSYTIASKAKDLLDRDAFRRLTKVEAMERGINTSLVDENWGKPEISEKLGFDPWGGRSAVGGSGWRTSSLIEPTEAIEIVFLSPEEAIKILGGKS